MPKTVDKNRLQSHSPHSNLTKQQQMVLYLYMDEHLSQSEIGRRLKTTRQNISRIMKTLKEKGLTEIANYNHLQKGGVVTLKNSVTKAKWRYHKLHFVIRPFYFEPRYHKWRLKKGNIFYSGDWRFVFHEDIVEVQIKENVDFCSMSKWEALDKAHRSFNKQLSIEANRYGFHVFKEGKANIRLCDQHLEESNSGVAKGRDDDSYVAIRGYHDNKIYFTFDKSKNCVNREYVHSDLAISDSEKFEPYFNSLRYKDHYLPHEQKEKIDTLMSNYVKSVEDATKMNVWMAENNKSHQKVLGDMVSAISELRKEIKNLKK